MPLLAFITRVISSVHGIFLRQLEASVFKETLHSQKVSSVWNNSIYNMWKKSFNFRRHRLKLFLQSLLSRSFASSSNGPSYTLHVYPFFPSINFIFKFLQFKGDKLYTKIMLLKNMGHRARSTAEDHRTSLVDPLVDKKQYLVLGMRAHLFP